MTSWSGVALEVEQHKKELGLRRGQRALVPRSHRPLARLPGVVALRALRLPRHLKSAEQPRELARIECGERA